VVAYAYNHSTWETTQEDHEFGASMGYEVRLCLKKKHGTEREMPDTPVKQMVAFIRGSRTSKTNLR
jgi:hypothetical protein